jgi:hypothetical protein
MFNRHGYNLSKFNAGTGQGGASAAGIFSLAAAGKGGRIRRSSGVCALSLGVSGKPTGVKFARAALSLSLGVSGKPTRRVSPAASPAFFSLGAQANYYAYGTEEIAFDGLVLRSGDELVIDTDLMTVTLNGVNIARYVRMNSQFINLLAGSNILVYQDKSGATRTANVRVEWKPRWL